MKASFRLDTRLCCILLLACALLLNGCGLLSSQSAPPTQTPEEARAENPEPRTGEREPPPDTRNPGTEDPERAPPSAQVTGPGGNLIMTLGAQDPPSLDPALVGDALSAFVVRQIFTGLVRLDSNMEVQPDLAESWEISEDRQTYTFALRTDARFADGTALTSEDVSYSLERATDPNLARSLPAQTYLTDIVGVREKLNGSATQISGVQIIDEHTIAITIDRPKSYFLSKLAHPTSFIVDRRAVERNGTDWTTQPNGSGPFEIERWSKGQALVLRRNINFYRDLAWLDRVTFLIGAAASNPLVLYEEGEIDVTGVSSFALDRVQDTSNPLSRELVSVPQLSLTYIGMNPTLPPFDDLKVRQAFSLLLDRQKIAEVSLNNSVQPARGILPPGMPGHNDQLPEPRTDREQARTLLNESKYGGAAGLPPLVAYGGSWTSTLGNVAEQELGISLEGRTYENFGDFPAELDQKQFPLFDSAWIADYPDPENFLDVLFRTGSAENYMNYSNPQVDALLDKAAVETDEKTRWALYQQAEQLILADVPVIPISYDIAYLLVKPYVKGFVVTPMGVLDLSTVELVRE